MGERTSDCPGTEVLEGIAAGATAPEQAHAHVQACASCRAALERIRDDNRFLGEFAVGGALPIQDAARDPACDEAIVVPGYDIECEIHRGGQGVVFRAMQRSTRRRVAIKVMKYGPFATLADRSRFEREIETLSRLNHPNIVAVHDAGAASGCQYFVMSYVEGCALDEAYARHCEGGRADVRAILDVFVRICDAVHAAHLCGVIHRDLKPSNIRVDSNGEPHILDFGLAKPIEPDGKTAMTRTGQFVGSLPWASPEQVEGESSRIDLRTDVYSLGAILFQLLTGALPFDVGSSLRDALDRILIQEPPRPSAVRSAAGGSGLDAELDTIVLKCLSKDRERRYQSAHELARDLRRYLAGEAIEAKRDSAMYVLRKTLKRYRFRVAGIVGFVLTLAVFSIVMTVLYRHSAKLEHEASQSADSLADLLSHSNVEQGRMAGLLGDLDRAEQLLWGESLMERAPAGGQAGRLHAPPGPTEPYWALWELYRRFPCLRTVRLAQPYNLATLAGDGVSLWTCQPDGHAVRVDAGGRVLDEFKLNLDGSFGTATAEASGELVLHYNYGHSVLWRRDTPDRPWIDFPVTTDGEPISLALSGGRRRAVGLTQGEGVVWELEPFQELARFRCEDGSLKAVTISPTGDRLAARDGLGNLHIWEVDSGRRLVEIPADVRPGSVVHSVGSLLFSPDGLRLADGWMQIAGRIVDLRTDPPTVAELEVAPDTYRVFAFNSDASVLAVGDQGGALRLFDARSGARLVDYNAHPARIRSLCFTADDRTIWTCSDEALRLWEAQASPGVRIMKFPSEALHAVDINPDGSWFAVAGGGGRVHRVFTSDGSEAGTLDAGNATVSALAISPDGRSLAAASYDRAVILWNDLSSPTTRLRLEHPGRVSAVQFSPDGQTLASACDDGCVRIWSRADGAQRREYRLTSDRIPQVAFDPTRPRLALVVRDGALLVCGLEAGGWESWIAATKQPLRGVRFTRDGRWMVVGGADRAVQVWDASGRIRVAALAGHTQEIYCLDVSPDGDWIASGDSSGTILLWHRRLERSLTTLDGHAGAVMSLRFSPDGTKLVSASQDMTARVWDLSHFAGHVAGQVPAQLGRLGLEGARAEEWRAWAEQAAREPRAGLPGTP